jgi:D-tyrosyl-tRNA(Tyr) deacylase
MRVVIQRVLSASVSVNQNIVGQIEKGLLVLVGFEETDSTIDYEWISKKIINLRIFSDENGVMNLNCQQVQGNILLVSQFTLYASTQKGNRPSYIKASKPEIAIEQYNTFHKLLSREFGQYIPTGLFGADMKVSLINDGPVTILIDSKTKE